MPSFCTIRRSDDNDRFIDCCHSHGVAVGFLSDFLTRSFNMNGSVSALYRGNYFVKLLLVSVLLSFIGINAWLLTSGIGWWPVFIRTSCHFYIDIVQPLVIPEFMVSSNSSHIIIFRYWKISLFSRLYHDLWSTCVRSICYQRIYRLTDLSLSQRKLGFGVSMDSASIRYYHCFSCHNPCDTVSQSQRSRSRHTRQTASERRACVL